MPGNRKSILTSELPKLPVVAATKQSYNYVKVRSLLASHLVYNGQETGQHYEWTSAGTIVNVDERDVPELLAKRIGRRSCCGENVLQGNKLFEIYDE